MTADDKEQRRESPQEITTCPLKYLDDDLVAQPCERQSGHVGKHGPLGPDNVADPKASQEPPSREWLEGENEQLRRDLKAEMDGGAALRELYGAHENETFFQFIERIATRGDRLFRALDDLANKAAPVALGMKDVAPASLYDAVVKARRTLDADKAGPRTGEAGR